ncbi:hypothetical protein vseg_001307 [Gypsophila vaccaria]
MDPLVRAASRGDVDFLRQLNNDNTRDELMTYVSGQRETLNGNFIHEAVKKNHYTFLSEALKVLPPEVVIELVCQCDKVEGSNPLHYAAKEGNIFTVKLLVNAYVTAAATLGTQGTPPWLTKNMNGNTPLRSCFTKKTKKWHEYVARYLVSRDHHLLRSLGHNGYPTSPDQCSTTALDLTGVGIFFCAVREGFSLLAEQILRSGLPYRLSGTYGENPLHHASKCNEQVSRLLLEKHPELIRKEPGYGGTVLDRAVQDNAAWLVELMLIEEKDTIQYCSRRWNKACRRLIWHINPDSFGDTPLHIAARKGFVDIAKLVVEGYESAIRDEAEEWDVAEAHSANDHLGVTPLHIENSQKDIPLFVALKNKHDDLGVYFLSIETIVNMAHLRDGEGKNAYEIAAENGCEQSRKTILERTVRHRAEDLLNWGPNVKNIHPSVLKIVRHIASTYPAMSEALTPENVVRLVVEGLPMFVREPSKDANLHLKEAAERGADWLVKLLLEGDSSLINDSTPAWQIACERGRMSTLLAFIEQCGHQEFISLCQNNHQTPLHHINLPSYEQYMNLLTNPVIQELKNQVDGGGATPLHRALERNNIGLTKALFESKGIKLDIKDQNHKTALDLLEEKYITNAHYFELYKELLANPLMTQELKNRVDNDGATSLHRAIERNDLALTKALLETKGIRLDIKDRNHKTAVDLLEDRCTANDYFFELYKELLANPLMTMELKNRVDDNGSTSLHRAILQNARRLVKALVETKGVKIEVKNNNGKTSLDLIEERCSVRSVDVFWYELYKKLLANPDTLHRMKNRRGSSGATPLHIAIEWDDHILAKSLVHNKGIKLNIEDTNGKAALDLIEEKCNQLDSLWYDLYEELLASTLMTYEMKNRVDINGATSLHKAVAQNSKKLAKTLLEIKDVEYEIKDNNGKTAVDMIEERCTCRTTDGFWFELYKKLLANPDMLQKLKNHRGSSGVTPLHIAIVWDDLKLAKTLVHTKGIELGIRDTNSKTALDLIEERCNHYDSLWYELYKDLLDNPNYVHELKNRRIGIDKETPLHRAIKWDDIKLAKTLLETKGVELDIVDRDGNTALDLLEERYKHGKWGEMCREIRLDPSLKIFKFKFLQRRTSLKDMQNTLSVVAALLATITFAASFTVPGGVDNKYGTATLGRKAAFLVFSISNTLAMCSSMVVLFTVIGAMIWEAHPKATPLIDFCVSLLQLSLCGTIVAFMTGVYAIMAPRVKWAAIVVIILCSLAFFVASIVVSTFWPLLYKPFKLMKGVACKLVNHIDYLNCCCNRASTDDITRSVSSLDLGHQLGTMVWQKTGQTPEGSTVAALQRREPPSYTRASTLVISRASDSSTSPASVQLSEAELSPIPDTLTMNGASEAPTSASPLPDEPALLANTDSCIVQSSGSSTLVAHEHSQQLLNTMERLV